MSPKPNIPVYQEEQEYKQVRKDLIKVVVLNIVFFALLIGLYIWDQSTNGVEHFFGKFLKF
jgi:hypothetical protein